MIDLDANASTGLLPEVLDAVMPWLRGGHANPSGVYRAAREARRAIDEARERVAGWIGALPEDWRENLREEYEDHMQRLVTMMAGTP